MKIFFAVLVVFLSFFSTKLSAQTTTYLWSNGATTSTINVNPSVTTTYRVTITNNGVSYIDSLLVTVNSIPSVTGSNNVCSNTTTQLTGTDIPAAFSPWVSTNTSVATVSNTGLVTGVTTGTTTISYTNNNGCSFNYLMTVYPSLGIVDNITTCGTFTWNGTTFTSSGTYTFANSACDVDTLHLTITPQPAAPTGLACYETANFNTATCSWDVTGTQPVQPTTACYEIANFNTATCSWDVTGTQPVQPTTACYETANFNTATCSWDVTGTQPAQPATACYETANFNTATCAWDVTGTQPAQPTTACYETANFNTATCSWDVTGTQPVQPTTACYETANFNTATCSWDVTGTQPVQPTTACYETANFNTATCSWDVTGTQPVQPTTACYETANFNTATCAWDVTGTQPAQPTTACYETANFNTATCSWDVTGTQPVQPTTACYETANFNTATCLWDVTGTQPAQPTTACYEIANFNTATCSWDVTGTQPVQPTTACYETANFNTATCAWDVTGTQVVNTATETSCGAYTWVINGQTYTTSGTYTETIGCVIEELVLTITPAIGTAATQTVCGSYLWNGTTYTTSGTYTFANNACDVDTLHLTITPQTGVASTQTVCGSYVWNGTTYTTSGTYTFANSACSVDTLHLTITPQTGIASIQTACGSYVWNGTTYTTSGTYTFANSACSVDTLHLTITTPFTAGSISSAGQIICDNSAPISVTSLTPASSGGVITYEWRANGVPIANSNSVNYSPASGLTGTITYTRWAKDNLCSPTFVQSTGQWTLMATYPFEVNATLGTTGPNFYNTISDVFTSINNGVHKGAVIVKVNCNSTSNIAASLNASGTGSSSYTSVRMYPTTTGLTISGSLNNPLITLNGADSVIIDGRVNGIGTSKSLTISNTNTGVLATTIRYINGAEKNIVRHSIISSSNRGANLSATIFFSTTTNTGNSNNIICDNTITTSSSIQTNRPMRSILSNGTESAPNASISISNNDFIDIFNTTASSYGIRTISGSSNWTINGNQFYQTDASFIPTDNNAYAPIDISSLTGNAFTISNNTIGGRSANAGGSQLTIGGAASSIFYGIRISAGTTSASNITNNTIKNIYHSSSNDVAFFGIRINDGDVNVTNNTIGGGIDLYCPVVKATAIATISGGVVNGISITNGGSGYTVSPSVSITGGGGTGLVVTSTVSSGQVSLAISSGGSGYSTAPSITISGSPIGRGIYVSGTGNIITTDNIISGITTSGANSNSVYGFYGIESASSASRTISRNTIGSDTEANSIALNNPSNSTSQIQSFYGITSSSSPNVAINDNIIANVKNAAISNSASVSRGILVTAGNNTIEGNNIHDISTASMYANAIGTNGTLVGIQNESFASGSVQVIRNNTVYNLSSTTPSADVRVRGIHFKGLASAAHVIEKNFVHSLAVSSNSTSAQLFGIYLESGSTTVSNNIVNVGTGASNGNQVFGIWEAGSASSNTILYHNTIVVSGTTSNSSTLTYALFSNSSGNTKNIRNNIFTNLRSSGSGSNLNFAMRLTAITGVTIDANDYFTNGTAGTILRLSGTNHSVLTTWRTATNQDANSFNLNPGFTTSPPSTLASHYVPSCGMNGINALSSSDYNGTARSNPPSIGAFEVGSRVPSVNNMTFTTCSATLFTVTPVNGVNGSVPPGMTYSWATPVVTGVMTGGTSGTAASSISGTLTNPTSINQIATYTVTPTSGSCQGSNFTVVVTIRPQITAGAISTIGQTICSGGDPGVISSVTPASGVNTAVLYSWRSSADNYVSSIVGATSLTYDPPALTAMTTFRRYASDTTCSATFIQSVGEWTVTIGSSTEVSTISGPSSVCAGGIANLVLNNSTGVNQWQSSTDNSNFTTILGATLATYNATNISTTTYYRVVITGGCAAGISPSFMVTVNQPTISISVNNTSIGNGDYLWNGNVSTNGSLVSNWYVYNDGVYSLASQLPTSQSKVFVIDYVNASTCVSNTNSANIPSLGSFESQNLYIGTGASLTLSPNATVNISGDMVVNGTLTSVPTATINFNGTAIQTISGIQAIVLDNLTVNKANGNLKLNAPVTVRGTLNMFGGNIITSMTNILEIGTSVTNPGLINWVDGSVVGPMKRWFAQNVNSSKPSGICPVGTEDINRNAQINFTETPSAGGYIVVNFKEGLAPDNYSNFPLVYNEGSNDEYIQNSDEVGYWEMTPYSANGQAYGSLDNVKYTLRLRINVPSSVSEGGHILNDPPGIRLIRAKGSANGDHEDWTVCGTYSSYVYNSSSDVEIESEEVEGFSWFNAGGNNANPLPVELFSFTGECIENDHVLSWKTASEHNSQSFEVQSSRDGLVWNTINTQVAAGFSNSLLAYNFIHTNVGNEDYYYRLNQVDFNGENKTYDPILISCNPTNEVLMTYPNPSEIGFNIIVKDDNLVGSATVTITDSKGRLVAQRTVEIINGTNMIIIDEPLVAGIYYIQLNNGANSSRLLKHVIY